LTASDKDMALSTIPASKNGNLNSTEDAENSRPHMPTLPEDAYQQ
jgi:hypothetical protein